MNNSTFLLNRHFKFFSLVLMLSLFLTTANSQTTIIIKKIPKNTPSSEEIFIAGNFNEWNPSSDKMIKNENGNYSFTVNNFSGNIEFKITRGNWLTVECNSNGKDIANRNFNPKEKNIVEINVKAWKDTFKQIGEKSIFSKNIFVFDEVMRIPQLKRVRRIWIYLPPDYSSSGKRYPVLYMHDGQNLFFNETSFLGEWGIDESLNKISAQQKKCCIVVGIDNGGQKRLDEYTPWNNPKHGGGEADKYVQFIVETLKPKIDSSFRTLKNRENTAIGGCSLGGLVTLYAGTKYNDVFSKLLVFSPALWINDSLICDFVQKKDFEPNTKIYIVTGGNEGEEMINDNKKIEKILKEKGFTDKNLKSLIVPGGYHNEIFWRKEFPDAFLWLFE